MPWEIPAEVAPEPVQASLWKAASRHRPRGAAAAEVASGGPVAGATPRTETQPPKHKTDSFPKRDH